MGYARRLLERATDYSSPTSIGSRLRHRRAQLLGELLGQIYRDKGEVTVADLGGTRLYWRTMSDEWFDAFNMRITLINLLSEPERDDDRFTYRQGDACALADVKDNSFDLVHANSVIEHVGDWKRMQAFAAEARRIGRRLYIQTPNFWFPFEPHFGVPLFHWLPETMRARLFMSRDLGHGHRSPDISHGTMRAQSARLLSRTQMQALFPDAEIMIERLGPLPKSLIAIR